MFMYTRFVFFIIAGFSVITVKFSYTLHLENSHTRRKEHTRVGSLAERVMKDAITAQTHVTFSYHHIGLQSKFPSFVFSLIRSNKTFKLFTIHRKVNDGAVN
jgi:hypothetical protein